MIIDEIAYDLYVKEFDKSIENVVHLKYLYSPTFGTMEFDGFCYYCNSKGVFYEKAKIILRKEKLEKLEKNVN